MKVINLEDYSDSAKKSILSTRVSASDSLKSSKRNNIGFIIN